MRLGGVRTFAALLAIVVTIATGRAATQDPVSDEERSTSPYLLLHGKRTMAERLERTERLGNAAETAGDFPRAARHFAIACLARSAVMQDITLALPTCQKARTLARDHHVVDAEVQMMLNEGSIRAWRLDVQGALKVLHEALERGASINPDVPEGSPITGAHYFLGTMLLEGGKFDLAEHELGFARDHCRVSGNSLCVAYADIWLCRLHTQLGNFGAARTACDAAHVEAAVDNDVFVMASLGWIRGNLEEALGRHDASLASLQGAWQAAQVRGAEAMRPTLMQLIADRLVTLGRLDEAEVWQRQLEGAMTAKLIPPNYAPQIAMRRGQIAMARGNLDEAIASFAVASTSQTYEMAIRADFSLAKARELRRDLSGARAALEHAIDKIETGRTNLNGAALRASYLTMHAKAYDELIGVRWDAEGVAAAPAALEIAEAGRARALLDQLMSAQVVGASALTLNAAAVQSTLGADEVLVEYVSSDDRLLALTVTRNRIAFTALPLAGTSMELAKRVEFFSALVQESDEATLAPTARRLYDDILAPALANVPGTARTLIIAADGPLHRLPFDALGEPPVLDRWDVVTLPSASALANRPRRVSPSAAALVVSAPAEPGGLNTLAAAPAESEAIRRRVGGEIVELSGTAATEQRLATQGLGRFAVIHFASHAVVDEERPLQSALLLAPGSAGGDRKWTAEEIYRTPISADLVVLSACSTAAGTQTPGEGVMSLARAFLYAGAGATVATLWDVPDAPGPVFADVLYRELAAGHTLGASVAEARRELRRSGAPPQAWAAYVLTGKPGTLVGVTPRAAQTSTSALIAGALALVCFAAALLIRLEQSAWRVRWPAPAMAGVALAVFAAILASPAPAPRMDLASPAERGANRAALVAAIYNRTLNWPPATGADEHIVEVFDADGVPVASHQASANTYALTESDRAGWIRVEARRDGQSLARSSLIRIR